jgi:hypothetical protein
MTENASYVTEEFPNCVTKVWEQISYFPDIDGWYAIIHFLSYRSSVPALFLVDISAFQRSSAMRVDDLNPWLHCAITYILVTSLAGYTPAVKYPVMTLISGVRIQTRHDHNHNPYMTIARIKGNLPFYRWWKQIHNATDDGMSKAGITRNNTHNDVLCANIRYLMGHINKC